MSTSRHTISLFVLLTLLLAAGAGGQTPDTNARFRLAQELEQAGNLDRAMAIYEEIFSRDPRNVVVFDALQRTLLQLKKYARAAELLRARLRDTPGDVTLLGQLGTALYRGGDEAAAIAVWDQIPSAAPANPVLYRHLASVLIENRLLERAADVYLRARAACGDPALFAIERAQLLGVSMDYRGAAEEYLRWLALNPTQGSFVQGRMSTFGWKPEERASVTAMVRAEAERGEALPIYELLGWLYMEAKEYDRALENARIIDARSSAGGNALLTFAGTAFREGAYAVAAQAYREVLALPAAASKLPGAAYGVARCLQELELQGDSTWGASPATPSRPGPAEVVTAFRRVIADHPRSEEAVRSFYQIGVVEAERRFDLDAALAAFHAASAAVSGIPQLAYDIALRLGGVDAARGDTAQAAAEYLRVAGAPDAMPEQTDEALFRLAELDLFAGRPQDAARRLENLTINTRADFANDAIALQSFLAENAKTALPALVRFGQGELLARQHRTGEAIAVFTDIVRDFPGALLLDDALLRIGMLQENAGLTADALKTYDRLLTEFRDQSGVLDRARFHLGDLYQRRLHDAPRAIAAFEALLAESPGSMLVAEARRRIRILRGEAL
jgi:tetratricopeptide (TPR) repeat protein